MLKHPFPLLLAVDAGAGLIAAHQAAAVQAGEDFGEAMVQTSFDQLEHVGQAFRTEIQAKHLGHERRQALVTDRVRVAQVRRQTLNGSPKWGAGFHPGRTVNGSRDFMRGAGNYKYPAIVGSRGSKLMSHSSAQRVGSRLGFETDSYQPRLSQL